MELMSALSQPIEVMKEIDIDSEIDVETATTTNAATGSRIIALTTSSTARLDLTYAEWLAVKRQAEARDKRLEELKKEVAKMMAQAKDSVKLVDESKEIRTEDDGEDISIPPEDEGVYDDDSDKVPQEEF